MRGVIYARYSEGSRQTDQSIEGQVDDCKAYARANDIDVIEIYADRHISGKSVDGRDEFQRMISDAGKHLFDCVIVWKIDRFGRNREDIAINKIRLRKAGVKLMYAKESIPDGPEGILLESLMEGLAEYYSADLRQKVIRGHCESAKKGQFTVGRLPIGYKKDQDQHIIIDEPKAAAVREVYRRHIEGASTDELRGILASYGILSQNGTPPVKAVVFRMLRNEKYLGKFDFHGIPIPAPPIISQATFDAAAANFKTSRHNGAGRATVEYLLSCKCHCEACGTLLQGTSAAGKSGKVYHYYYCPKCHMRHTSTVLEDAVIDHTIDDVLTDQMISELSDRIMAIQKENAAHDEASVYRQQLDEVRKKESRIMQAIEDGGARTLSKRLAELEDQEDELTVKLEKAMLKKPIVPKEIVEGWLRSFRVGDDRKDPAFRKKLVRAFISDVIIARDHVTIYYNITKEPHRSTSERCSCTALIVDARSRCANTGPAVLSTGYIVLRVPL